MIKKVHLWRNMAVPSSIMQQVKKCRNTICVWPACVCVHICKNRKIQKIHDTRLWRFREMIEENEAVKMKSSL